MYITHLFAYQIKDKIKYALKVLVLYVLQFKVAMEERYGFKPEFSPNLSSNCPYHSNPSSLSYSSPHPPNSCNCTSSYYPPNSSQLYPPLNNSLPTAPPQFNNSAMYSPPPPSNYYHNQAYRWVDTVAAHGVVPSTALQGGIDIDGHLIYVGRAFHDGDWIPAKVIPGKNVAYVAYNGEEHAVDQFQVLCEQRFDWVSCQGGFIPPGSVQGGHTSEGEPLYIGRAQHEGSNTVGKVHPSHGVCYIPFGGKEIAYQTYEILVLRS